MASRTINITDEAYALLRSRKREGESFTDVIKRLAGFRSLSELEGILTPVEAQGLEKAVRAGRRRSRARRARQGKELRRAARR